VNEMPMDDINRFLFKLVTVIKLIVVCVEGHFTGNFCCPLPVCMVDAKLRPESKPVLTAENYSKWYELFLVMPDGTVGEVGFGELHELADERGVSPYVDHVPNPSLVSVLAERRGWSIDHVSYEVMVGRWEIEVVHSDG